MTIAEVIVFLLKFMLDKRTYLPQNALTIPMTVVE